MAASESVTGVRDKDYNLISVLYHALQGGETSSTYIDDAKQAGDQDLARFFEDVQEDYRRIGNRAKDLLKKRVA